jgi:predicted kinase
MCFIRNGEYIFDPKEIKAAHDWCQQSAMRALSSGMDVVVSNTFVRLWEMNWYLASARDHGHETKVLVTTGNYTNTHGVPQAVIDRMRLNWEES